MKYRPSSFPFGQKFRQFRFRRLSNFPKLSELPEFFLRVSEILTGIFVQMDRARSLRFPRARFPKLPKIYGPFSGVAIPFVSQERRGFKSSNFTVIFLFVTLKHVKRSALQTKRLAVSQMSFRVRKDFGTFMKRSPGPQR